MKKLKIASAILLILLILSLLPCAFADSWSMINQDLDRGENWRRIVTDSPFRLGEAVPCGDGAFSVRSYGSYPSIDGSTVSVPLALELARQLLDLPEDDLKGFVNFSTTPYAYERLIFGQPNPTVTLLSRNETMDPVQPVELILVTEPSDEELALAEAAGAKLVYVPFCYDAFIFLVNENNPVTSLTTGQIRAVYRGDIIDWGDVGGVTGRTILPFQRPKNSGSQTAMENMVMKGDLLPAAKDNFISFGMDDLVSQIGNYDNSVYSLGYSFLYYVNALYTDEHIKVLSVDGVAPTEANLRSGAYPYTVCYWAVFREEDADTRAFVEWLTGPEGQACVRQAGYIPIGE